MGASFFIKALEQTSLQIAAWIDTEIYIERLHGKFSVKEQTSEFDLICAVRFIHAVRLIVFY